MNRGKLGDGCIGMVSVRTDEGITRARVRIAVDTAYKIQDLTPPC